MHYEVDKYDRNDGLPSYLLFVFRIRDSSVISSVCQVVKLLLAVAV